MSSVSEHLEFGKASDDGSYRCGNRPTAEITDLSLSILLFSSYDRGIAAFTLPLAYDGPV